jgi:tetratricopeptide (TPR) repeat protein
VRERLGDYDEAERAYGRALKLGDARDPALEARAWLRYKRGKRREATDDLAARVETAPTEALLRQLSSWYVELRAYSAALSSMRRLHDLGVNDERTKVSIVALTELSNTTDLATHIEPEDDWVRRSLCTLASTGATNEAPSAQ